jgi:hypothetical protein
MIRRIVNNLFPAWISVLGFALTTLSSVGAAADFELILVDLPGQGFLSNSPPDPVSAAAGNTGTNLGEQRQWAFSKAAEFWGQRLESSETITIEAHMEPLTCSSYSAVLGSAGPNNFLSNFSGALFADTWYPVALANRLAGFDLRPAEADIGARFNSSIDNNSNCLINTNWYYGLGDAPPGTISFFDTVLHEIGHGLGVLTLVDLATGTKPLGIDDIYMKSLEDHSLSQTWPTMTNTQRQASAIDNGDLHWVGTAVQSQSSSLAAGRVGTHVRMYAPGDLSSGSSVSHFDTVLSTPDGYDDIMEPSATPNQIVAVTDGLLADIGWNAFEGDCTHAQQVTVDNQVVTTTSEFSACDSVILGGNTTLEADVTVRAGRIFRVNEPFGVSAGYSLNVDVNPLMTLKN